eukprot:scaffold4007_cov362-Prasinococcus_capsulatus_cf.AAC.4
MPMLLLLLLLPPQMMMMLLLARPRIAGSPSCVATPARRARPARGPPKGPQKGPPGGHGAPLLGVEEGGGAAGIP